MIAPLLIVVWSVLCLAYAGTQTGFSITAFVAWDLGVLAVMLIASWMET